MTPAVLAFATAIPLVALPHVPADAGEEVLARTGVPIGDRDSVDRLGQPLLDRRRAF